jgi:hypothetical protein
MQDVEKETALIDEGWKKNNDFSPSLLTTHPSPPAPRCNPILTAAAAGRD